MNVVHDVQPDARPSRIGTLTRGLASGSPFQKRNQGYK